MVKPDKLARIVANRKRFAEDVASHGWASWPILNQGPDPEWFYLNGFELGAEILLRYILDNQAHPDELVYPAVFLYRHWAELALKRLLRLCAQLGADVDQNLFGKHALWPIWEGCRPTVVTKASGVDINKIDERVKQLDEIDRDSQRFRYAETRDHQPSHAPMTNFSLVEFGELMKELGALGLVDLELSELISPSRDGE